MEIEVVLKGALPPILTALLLVSLAGVRLLPLAMALGLYIAHGLLKGWPALPHELWANPNGREWLLWGLVAASLLAALEHCRLLPQKLAPIAAVVVAAATVWLELGKVAAFKTNADVIFNIGGGGIVVAVVVLAARASIARAPAGIASAVVWSTILSVDSVLLTLGATAFLGQLCGAVAAAIGAAAGTVLWRRPFALTPADGTWLGLAHGGFLLGGKYLNELGWAAAGVAMFAPCALLLLRGRVTKRPWVYGVAATAMVVGANAWFVYQLAVAAQSEPGYR